MSSTLPSSRAGTFGNSPSMMWRRRIEPVMPRMTDPRITFATRCNINAPLRSLRLKVAAHD
jgi:hypothetical protein